MTKEEILATAGFPNTQDGIAAFYEAYDKPEKFFAKHGGNLSGAPHNGQPTAKEFFSYGSHANDGINIPMGNPLYLQKGGNKKDLESIIDKYRFLLNNDESANDEKRGYGPDYLGSRLNNLEGLSDEEVNKVFKEIKSNENYGFGKINRSFAEAIPDYKYKIPESKDFDLYTGNENIQNIGKYRPDANLNARMPFGYGREDDLTGEGYAYGGIPMAQAGVNMTPQEWAKQEQLNLINRTGVQTPKNKGNLGAANTLFNPFADDSDVSDDQIDSSHVFPNNPNLASYFKGDKMIVGPAVNTPKAQSEAAKFNVGKIFKMKRNIFTPAEAYANYQENGGFIDYNNNTTYPIFSQGGYDYEDGGMMNNSSDNYIYNYGGSYDPGLQKYQGDKKGSEVDYGKLADLKRQEKNNNMSIEGILSSFRPGEDTTAGPMGLAREKARAYQIQLANKIKNHPDNIKKEEDGGSVINLINALTKAKKKAYGGANSQPGGNQSHIENLRSTFDGVINNNVHNALINEQADSIKKEYGGLMQGREGIQVNPNLYKQNSDKSPGDLREAINNMFSSSNPYNNYGMNNLPINYSYKMNDKNKDVLNQVLSNPSSRIKNVKHGLFGNTVTYGYRDQKNKPYPVQITDLQNYDKTMEYIPEGEDPTMGSMFEDKTFQNRLPSYFPKRYGGLYKAQYGKDHNSNNPKDGKYDDNGNEIVESTSGATSMSIFGATNPLFGTTAPSSVTGNIAGNNGVYNWSQPKPPDNIFAGKPKDNSIFNTKMVETNKDELAPLLKEANTNLGNPEKDVDVKTKYKFSNTTKLDVGNTIAAGLSNSLNLASDTSKDFYNKKLIGDNIFPVNQEENKSNYDINSGNFYNSKYGGYMQQGGYPQQSAQQPNQEQIVQGVAQMLQQGAQPEEIAQQLIQMGLPQEEAMQLIQAVMQQLQGGQEQQPMQYGGYGMNEDEESYEDDLTEDEIAELRNGGYNVQYI